MTVVPGETLELIPPQEQATTFQATFDLTAAVANHELKALTLVTLGLQEGYLNKTALGNALRDTLKTAGAEWLPNTSGAFSYCKNSFEPIGQVVKGETAGARGPTVGFALSEKGKEVGVPYAGLIMDWSLRHPDISVQAIFGPSHSKGDTRSPQHRAELLLQLATHPRAEVGLSIRDIAELNPADYRTVAYHARICALDQASRALEKAGLVHIARVSTGNDRLFEIIDPNPTPSVLVRTNLTVTTKKLFEFMQETVAGGSYEFSFEQCLDAVVAKVLAEQPDYDPQKIRETLTNRLTGGSSDTDAGVGHGLLPGVSKQIRFNQGAHTRVLLNPKYADAVGDIVVILNAIEDRDEAMLDYGRQRAREILASPEDTKFIADKAYHFSPAARKLSRAVSQSQFMSILQDAEAGLDATQLGARYGEKFGRELSRASVLAVMRQLVEAGEVEQLRERSDPSVLTKRNYYRAVPPMD